jgi:tetratricopeptide (TPR) repeat protein
LTLVVLFSAGLFWTFRVFKQEDKSQYYLASDFSINAMKLLPSKSIFLAEGDNYVVPIFYQRYVQGLRPDIVFVPSIFLFHDWGWKQLTAQDAGIAEAIKTSHTFDGRIVALTTMGGRELYNTLDQTYLSSVSMKGDWIPNALEKHWSESEPKPVWVSGNVLLLANTERFRGLKIDYDPEDITTFEIRHYYANQYFSTGGWLREKGDWEDALRCFELGLPFFPRATYAYGYMAAILGSEGYFGLAEKLCLLGIVADSGYFGNYENLGNVYRIQGELLNAKECYQDAINHVSDPKPFEIHLMELEKIEEAKPRNTMRDKGPREYQVLANRFKKEGMFFLGGLAGQVGQAGH